MVALTHSYFVRQDTTEPRKVAKRYRSEDKTCAPVAKVKNSLPDYNYKKIQAMGRLTLSHRRDEKQLNQEFGLDTSCFDMYPTIADISIRPETLQMRWLSLWSRMSFSLQASIKEAINNRCQ